MTILARLKLGTRTERRKHERIDGVEAVLEVVVDGHRVLAALESISMGGALMFAAFPRGLEPGQTVTLMLEPEDAGVVVSAEILRRRDRDACTQELAVAFRDLIGPAREIVERYVAKRLEEAGTAPVAEIDDTVTQPYDSPAREFD